LEIIKEAHAKARAILSDNRDKLDELAKFLLDKETITGEEFMAVLNGDYQELEKIEEQQA
jgi:cell division protease FtsH